jgi:hypothetical protein
MQINISLYSDLFEKYFNSRKEYRKNTFEYNLVSIIDNPNNRIVLTKNYLRLLDEIYHPDSNCYDDYSNFMTFIIDGNCQIIESNNSETVEEEFIFIANNCCSTTISILENEKDLNIKNYLCLNKVDSCPTSKVYLSLLKDRTAIVRYSDFENNLKLEGFFKEIFSFPRGVTSTIVIERYANINHPYFDYFAEENILVKYYKLRATLLDGNSLKRKFSRLELYNTTNPELVHERLIIIGNLILNIDEDPMNLDVARNTWTISLTYSQEEAKNLMRKCSSFSRATFV